MTGHHVTDEEFTALLVGDYAGDASEHLRGCLRCRQELGRVQASLEDFSSLSLEWAEERAARSISTPSALLRDWQTASAFTAVAATVLAAAALVGVRHDPVTTAPAPVAIARAQAPDSDAQVANDNRLLMAIDGEIRWQAEAPISVEDLATPAGRARARLTN
jgi:hypothetical protein